MSIAIEIGNTGIRAAQVAGTAKKPQIKKLAEIDLAHGIVVNGDIRDEEAIIEAIKDLWKIGKFSSKTVSIGLSGKNGLIRQLELPWEEPETFREALPLRVGDDLPIDPSELTLDYHPLETYLDGTNRMQKFLLVGGQNVVIESLADILNKAGLRVTKADYTPFGLIRLSHALSGSPAIPTTDINQSWDCDVIIDMGSTSTTIAIHYNSRPLFVRTVDGGAAAITKAISEQLGISMDEAAQVQKAVLERSDSVNDKTRKIVDYINKALVNGLVQSVRESIDFFRGASQSMSSIANVWVSGGGTLVPGYAERVASELAAPVRSLNPLSSFAPSKLSNQYGTVGQKFAGVVGIALEVK